MVSAFLLVEAVGERGRRRLVDDAQHVSPAIRPASLVACRWRVVEVGAPRSGP